MTVCLPVIIFRDLVQTSLAGSAGQYVPRANGDFVFPGRRPEQGHWHGHGYFPKTSQRWLHKLLPYAMNTQQAIRRAVIGRCEPRPFETLFEGDLSPPKGLERRPWKDPASVSTLWRAFAILFRGALGLDVPVAHHLAEARGRWGDPEIQKLFCPSGSPAPGR